MTQARGTSEEDEKLRVAIADRIDSFARSGGYGFSPAKEKIVRELVRMHKRFGDFYCPCQPENVEETVCVCTEVKAGYVDEIGRCH
ncbi:MAG: hypothetical protein Q7O66_05320 [Dehalococcoidia bacterium]|nr:hypothetical protein [Dehalococcoidia bacterium]